jgi:hypothetical protein
LILGVNKHKPSGRWMIHGSNHQLLQMLSTFSSFHGPTSALTSVVNYCSNMQRPRQASPSNENGSSSRAESVTQEQPSTLDNNAVSDHASENDSIRSATNDVHINGQQEDSTTNHDPPRNRLRRRAGQVFDRSAFSDLGRVYANRNASFPSLHLSDPEAAPYIPHIVPPPDGWSSTEESSPPQAFPLEWGTPVVVPPAPLDIPQTLPAHKLDPQNPLTRSEAITCIKELIELRTASSIKTLQCFKNLDFQLTTSERQYLIEIAKYAGIIARREYKQHRDSSQSLSESLCRHIGLPLPDVDDYEHYLRDLKLQVRQLEDAVSCFPALQGPAEGIREMLDGMCVAIKFGGEEVEMAELRWLVERKCMYWAAIDIMAEKTVESERDQGKDRSARRCFTLRSEHSTSVQL